MTLRYVFALAALLTAIGLSMFVYKWQVLGFPVTDNHMLVPEATTVSMRKYSESTRKYKAKSADRGR